MKENIRRITITGVHKLDMVIYWAMFLQKLQYKVLVFDRTAFGEIRSCIKSPLKSINLVRYRQIDFAFSELTGLEEDYDYILCVQDFLEISNSYAGKSVFICDGTKKHLELLIQEFDRIQWSETRNAKDCMLIYRDIYASYGMEYAKKSCIAIQDMKVRIVPHECMDEAGYQRMQFYPFGSLPELSQKMENCLKEVLEQMTGLEERTIKRAVKLARRGKAY